MARKTKNKRKRSGILKFVGYALFFLVAFSVLLVLPLRWFDPPTSAFMMQDRSDRRPLLHDWVNSEELGTNAALAVVASEDQRFADHHGIDFKAIKRAVDEKDDRGYLRGASTITQQTVKNLYLWPGRSFARKVLEAWLALVADSCLPKQRILDIYLNIAEFGPGVYGVGAASDYFFGTSPAQLDTYQAALLAAVLPNPKKLSVSDPSDYVRERQAWIRVNLERLEREGWITRIRP